MKTTFLILYSFLLLSTCQQQQVQYDNSVATTTVTESVGNVNSSKDEIFIGKEFYAGDELSDYEFIKNSSYFKSDSLCYSVYKPLHYHYFVFSLEKFLSNEDVEKFRILDTLHLKNIAHINFIHNELGASLFLDDKKIKEWIFNKTPNITTPEDIVITEEGIIQNDNGEMIQFKNITEVINRIQKSKLFTLKKMYLHDLNQDGNKDIFLVFKNNNDLKSDDHKTLVAPVILLIHQGGDKYKFFHNEKIYPSMEVFFFKRIAFKDNFFTIELNTEVPDEYTAEKYITFKYSKNKIVLHQFGDITYWWDERKPFNAQLTQKDFGEILFEDYDPEKIDEIIYK
ncbi:hypothetical protein [Capnocytophaga periodontitidis]|uniref:hypothetical protein n=1 Tax=Capnocytophaga periodontitidis TaxID=2795027 RepID=UPI001CEC2BC0|nr:hypothetical protein [Capnocytophaga periodontitidis]